MELILLRHAIPVDPDRWDGDDFSRPLTSQGEAQARETLEALIRSSRRIEADEIWHSPFVRCAQTARIAAEFLAVPLRPSPALASGADLLRSLPRVQGNPDRWPARLLCVGHSPDLGYLISALTGAPPGQHALGRCGSARLSGRFEAGQMKLLWMMTSEQAVQGPKP